MGTHVLLLNIIAAGPDAAGVQYAVFRLNTIKIVKMEGSIPICGAKENNNGVIIKMIAILL